MSDNSQKLWFGRSANSIGVTRANDRKEQVSKGVPCTVVSVANNMVTVKLEINGGAVVMPMVTIPQAFPEWIRPPTQVGDKGYANPNDYYMGGQSGMGGGTADLYPRANLTNLVFQHNSQQKFMQVDANSAVLYGPNGVTLMTQDKSVQLVLTPSGIAVKGNLTVTGQVTAGMGTTDSVTMQNHTHTNVTAGPNLSGPPQAGT